MERPESETVPACSGDPVELDGVRAEVFRLHNKERTERDIPTLCWSETLAAAATGHSGDMMKRGFYAHDTSEGVEPSDRTLAAGYDSSFVAENIHRTYMSSGFEPNKRDTRKLVRDWMESPGHRRNMLDARLKEVGSGWLTVGSATKPTRRGRTRSTSARPPTGFRSVRP